MGSALQPGLRTLILAAVLVSASSASAPASAADGFGLNDSPGQALDVVLDGKPVARYVYAYDSDRFEETYKPFLHVLDADGKAPITKGPGGLYTHHRGIFIGWTKVTIGGKSYNLWGMGGGVQIHRKFLNQETGLAGRAAVVTSLTHLRVDENHPLSDRIQAYQRRRSARIAGPDRQARPPFLVDPRLRRKERKKLRNRRK